MLVHSDDQQQIAAASTTQQTARNNIALIQKCVVLNYPSEAVRTACSFRSDLLCYLLQTYEQQSGGYQRPPVYFNLVRFRSLLFLVG